MAPPACLFASPFSFDLGARKYLKIVDQVEMRDNIGNFTQVAHIVHRIDYLHKAK